MFKRFFPWWITADFPALKTTTIEMQTSRLLIFRSRLVLFNRNSSNSFDPYLFSGSICSQELARRLLPAGL